MDPGFGDPRGGELAVCGAGTPAAPALGGGPPNTHMHRCEMSDRPPCAARRQSRPSWRQEPAAGGGGTEGGGRAPVHQLEGGGAAGPLDSSLVGGQWGPWGGWGVRGEDGRSVGLPAHFLRHSRRKEPLPSSAGGGLIWLASGNPRPRAGGCGEQQEGHTKAAGLGELPSGSGSRHSLAAASPSRFQSLEGSLNLIQCLRTMWAVGGTQGQALLPEAFLPRALLGPI